MSGSRPCWRNRFPTLKSVQKPISLSIARRGWMRRGPRCAIFSKPLQRERRIGNNAAMREIVFDTETTGLDPFDGHRVVEIGCIELLNRIPTGNTFHVYLNPERDVPAEAFNVHGL